jgi:predicted MFS family arabinose efflux permease
MPRTVNPVWAVVAGLCLNLVTIGMARFGYTPLLPSLIQAHWFATDDIVTLSAANFAGYLGGALSGRALAKHLSNRTLLRGAMLSASIAFIACAFPLSVSWFFFWRLASGLAGGMAMVLVAQTVLPHIPAGRRGFASGAIFMGLGLGIAGSGTLVPLLLHFGLRSAWLGLALLSLILTALCWRAWPEGPPKPTKPPTPTKPQNAAADTTSLPVRSAAIRMLYAEYTLIAVGLVPAMVFLVDFIARGLDRGAATGSMYWVLYGLSAVIGPPLSGMLVDRAGAERAVRFEVVLQVLATFAFAVTSNAWLLGFATVLMGAFTSSMPVLYLSRVQQLLAGQPDRQHAAWSQATVLFALFQALSGYGYSFLFNHSGGHYRLLFICGFIGFVLCLSADIATSRLARKEKI